MGAIFWNTINPIFIEHIHHSYFIPFKDSVATQIIFGVSFNRSSLIHLVSIAG